MPRRDLALILVPVLALACAGLPFRPGAPAGAGLASRQACEGYVDHVNGLPCMSGLNYDKVEMCGALELSPVDMTAYYECLVAGSTCDGTVPSIRIDACRAPAP